MTHDGSPEHLTFEGLPKNDDNPPENKPGDGVPPQGSSPPPETVDFGDPETDRAGRPEPIGRHRRDRINRAVLRALERRLSKDGTGSAGQSGSASPPPPNPASDPISNPTGLTFAQPPGLLPTSVRKNLQGDVMPQVTPEMMRTPSWQVSIFQS